jgi:serine/threonine protein kinase
MPTGLILAGFNGNNDFNGNNVNSLTRGLQALSGIITSPIQSVGTTIQVTSADTETLELTLKSKVLGSGLEADIMETSIGGTKYALKQYKSYTVDGLVNSLRAHYIASNKDTPNPIIICLHAIICSDNIKSRIRTGTDIIPDNFFYRRTEPVPSEHETYCYALFEYIDGVTMYDYKNKESEVLPLTQQLFGAVHYLHTIGIAHRDIKPSNVMITRDGRLKLIDLGSACFIGQCGKGASTKEYTMSKYYTYTNTRTQNDFAFNNDIYACLLTVYYMLSSSDKFSAPHDSLWPQNDNAGYMKIPEEYRHVLRKYIELVSDKPITDIAECKTLMDNLLREFQARGEGGGGGGGGSTYGGRRRKYKRTQKLKHKRRKTMRKRLVRLRGGGKDLRLINAVLTDDINMVIDVLADLILETKGTAGIGQPNEPLVDSEIYRSTSGKTPLFFTIRHKTPGTLGFGGSSSCLPKKIFNKKIYILLRLLGARTDIQDKDGNSMLESEDCQAFANDILKAEADINILISTFFTLPTTTTASKDKGRPDILNTLIKRIQEKDTNKSVYYGILYDTMYNMMEELKKELNPAPLAGSKPPSYNLYTRKPTIEV